MWGKLGAGLFFFSKILINSITIIFKRILLNVVYSHIYLRSVCEDSLIATDVNNAMF